MKGNPNLALPVVTAMNRSEYQERDGTSTEREFLAGELKEKTRSYPGVEARAMLKTRGGYSSAVDAEQTQGCDDASRRPRANARTLL